jgi:hypothetical protein
MRLHLGLLFLLVPGCVFGWESYKTDVTQQTTAQVSDGLDHLEPVDRKIPETPYLVEFIREPAKGYQQIHLTLSRDSSTGNFYLHSWNEWRIGTEVHPPTEVLGPSTKIECPEDIAANVYSMWVNALLEVRYDRLSSSMNDEGRTDLFSVYLKGHGYLHGTTASPTKDLPPKWMEDSATALIQYTKDNNEAACRRTLTDLRDKLFAYLATNGKH